jgi:hypothetical protein
MRVHRRSTREKLTVSQESGGLSRPLISFPFSFPCVSVSARVGACRGIACAGAVERGSEQVLRLQTCRDRASCVIVARYFPAMRGETGECAGSGHRCWTRAAPQPSCRHRTIRASPSLPHRKHGRTVEGGVRPTRLDRDPRTQRRCRRATTGRRGGGGDE